MRDIVTIYVGFAYLNAPQLSGIETKLANPTRLIADRRLNPTYDLVFELANWILPKRKFCCADSADGSSLAKISIFVASGTKR